MGMFDTIRINVKCPACGEDSLHDCQTKEMNNELEYYEKDEAIPAKFQHYETLNCITQCRCEEFINLQVEVFYGVITGEYKIESHHNWKTKRLN